MQLSQLSVKRCMTAAAWTLFDGKVLLIKHKKLGIWLAPGGHVEENELPHLAAEREFFEETGIKGKVVSATAPIVVTNSEFLPLPFLSNLHTINKPRASKNSFCEQHIVFLYYIRIQEAKNLKRQVEEVDDIGWFERDELASLGMPEDIITEANYVFDHFPV